MDFTTVGFTIALSGVALIFIIFNVVDIIRKRKKQQSGFTDADTLLEDLNAALPEGEYVVLHDVPVMTLMGRSMVDYIIVSTHGIFLMEYRAYVKEIFFDEFKHKWGLLIRVREEPFTNPLWQSKVHSLSIQEMIGAKEGLTYYPMAAFPNMDELTNRNFNDVQHTCFVGRANEVLPWIRQWTDEELTREEVAAIVELIQVKSAQVDDMEEPELDLEEGKLPREYELLLVDPNKPTITYKNAYGKEITEAEYFARQDAMEAGYHADSVVFDLESREWVIDEELDEMIKEAVKAETYEPSMLDEFQKRQSEGEYYIVGDEGEELPASNVGESSVLAEDAEGEAAEAEADAAEADAEAVGPEVQEAPAEESK